MEKKILNEWWKLYRQVKNGYHLSEWDKKELVRLNHLVMEQVHKIHNDRMLGQL